MVADAQSAVDTSLGSKKSLLQALIEDCCLKDPSDRLIEWLGC
jgi:sulfite reductase (NADPH) flavoprotein alpha-component